MVGRTEEYVVSDMMRKICRNSIDLFCHRGFAIEVIVSVTIIIIIIIIIIMCSLALAAAPKVLINGDWRPNYSVSIGRRKYRVNKFRSS